MIILERLGIVLRLSEGGVLKTLNFLQITTFQIFNKFSYKSNYGNFWISDHGSEKYNNGKFY